MAAFKPHKLLILQSSLSSASVSFMFPGTCCLNFCLSPASIREIVSRNKARPMRNMQVLFGSRYSIPESWLHLRKTLRMMVFTALHLTNRAEIQASPTGLGRVEVINPCLPSLY